MIRKLLPKDIKCFFFVLVLLGFTTFSQAQSILKSENIFSSENVASEDLRTQDVIVSWNFSQVSNREQLSNLSIEVQPLNGCWNKLEGSNRSEKIIFPVNNFSQNEQASMKFSHNQLKSKCFKWRAKINHNSEIAYTEWQFSSFL